MSQLVLYESLRNVTWRPTVDFEEAIDRVIFAESLAHMP